MDSFIFHLARLSLYRSFSADSEITPPFCFNPNPYPSINSTILSSLLNQEDGLTTPNSSSQTLSCGSGASFSHPPAWIVEDLSNWAGSHIVPSTAESTNWFGPQENLLDLWNPPILSPVSQNSSISLSSHQDPPILSPVQQVVQLPLTFQQHIPSHHPCIPNDFSGLQRFCTNFLFPAHPPNTGASHLFNLAAATIFPGGDVHSQLWSSIERWLLGVFYVHFFSLFF